MIPLVALVVLVVVTVVGCSSQEGGSLRPSAPASPTSRAAQVTGGCTTVMPGPTWLCVDGNWVPPDHPLAAGLPGFVGGTGGSGGSSGSGSNGTTGTCTTPDPFIGIRGLEGVCVDGSWVPSNHPIALAQPVTDYSGVYTLTLTADSCSQGFPEAAKQRVYTARIQQSGRDMLVFLSGADLLLLSGTFAGRVSVTGEVSFWILDNSYYYYYYSNYQLVERIDNNALTIDGEVKARPTGRSIVAALSGRFTLNQGISVPFTQMLGSCVSKSHRFELVPQ